MSRTRYLFFLPALLVMLLIVIALATMQPTPAPTPALDRPTPRPTFPFPTGTSVPVTSAEDVLIESEPGPLYVILSTVDEHGLKGQALIPLANLPDSDDDASAGTIRSGTFARVLEIRRLPPDYLRGYYLVTVDGLTGWVNEFLAHRTVYVIAFDEARCACPGPVPLWADSGLTQAGGTLANRSPLRLLALGERSVKVQVLSDGATGWLNRDLVHESQEEEYLKYIRP